MVEGHAGQEAASPAHRTRRLRSPGRRARTILAMPLERRQVADCRNGHPRSRRTGTSHAVTHSRALAAVRPEATPAAAWRRDPDPPPRPGTSGSSTDGPANPARRRDAGASAAGTGTGSRRLPERSPCSSRSACPFAQRATQPGTQGHGEARLRALEQIFRQERPSTWRSIHFPVPSRTFRRSGRRRRSRPPGGRAAAREPRAPTPWRPVDLGQDVVGQVTHEVGQLHAQQAPTLAGNAGRPTEVGPPVAHQRLGAPPLRAALQVEQVEVVGREQLAPVFEALGRGRQVAPSYPSGGHRLSPAGGGLDTGEMANGG